MFLKLLSTRDSFSPARTAVRRGSLFFVFSIFSIGFATHAYAVASLSITLTNDMSYGTLQKPTSGLKSMVLQTDDTFSGASDGTLLFGTPLAGKVRITRSGTPAPTTIGIDVQNASCVSAYTIIQEFTGLYMGTVSIASFPVSGMTEPGTTGKNLKVGAKLRYSSSVTVGSYTCSYDVVATLE